MVAMATKLLDSEELGKCRVTAWFCLLTIIFIMPIFEVPVSLFGIRKNWLNASLLCFVESFLSCVGKKVLFLIHLQ